MKNTNWPRTDVDRFLLARIEEAGLAPAVDAEPRLLLRRLYFDLIGLPPTPQQVAEFDRQFAKSSQAAVEAVVDELLASQHFGERWGRHWLDVARFSESSGGGRSRLLQDAWRYRDYVFDSLNRDRPFNEFVRLQIAGDLLTADTVEERARQITATGFLVLGPANYELQDKELLRMDVVDEQIDAMGRAFLGMTIGCARCHDHKFDPIPTTDYYALAGIFRSTKTLTPGNVSGFETRPLPVKGELGAEIAKYKQQVAGIEKRLTSARDVVAQLKQQLPGSAKPTGNVDESQLAGIVVDNTAAEQVGDWKVSTYSSGYVGANYLHDDNKGKGEKSLTYRAKLPAAGEYEVRVAYRASSSRSDSVPYIVRHASGESTVSVDQKKPLAAADQLLPIGKFQFDVEAVVVISNEGTTGHVIGDAVQFVPVGQTSATPNEAADPKQAKQAAQLLAQLKPQITKAEVAVKTIEEELAAAKKAAPQQPVAMAVKEEAKTSDYFVCIRGNVHKLGEPVPRGFLSVTTDPASPVEIPPDQSGRLQLADWLAQRSEPAHAAGDGQPNLAAPVWHRHRPHARQLWRNWRSPFAS